MKLIHFTAEWCGPCQMMKPMIDQIVSERDDLDYVMVDIDNEREYAIAQEIMSVPTFILEGEDGTVLKRFSGGMPRQKFLDALGI